MNRLPLFSICALAILIFGGCKTETPKTAPANENRPVAQTSPDPYANARALYVKDCQGCHSPKGEGGPVKLDDGTRLKVPTLLEGHALKHNDDEYIKQITKGGDGMPAFDGKLTPDQMKELVRFIRHEFQGK